MSFPAPVTPNLERFQPSGADRGKLTRRQLLVRGGLATAGLLIAGVFVRVATLFDQRPAPGQRSLSEREIAILGPLVEALFPGGDMPPGDVQFITRWVDDFLAHTDEQARLLFKAMLHVLEDQSLVTGLSRFSKRSLEARMAEVRKWEVTPIYLERKGFQTVKLVIALGYFEQPGTQQALGWYVGCAPEHLLHKTKNAGSAALDAPPAYGDRRL